MRYFLHGVYKETGVQIDPHASIKVCDVLAQQGKYIQAGINAEVGPSQWEHTSIRIGTETVQNCKENFEDRRPGSNIDPYVVIKVLNDSTLNM